MPAKFAFMNYFSYLCIAFPPIGVHRLMNQHAKMAIALVIYAAAVICAACRVTRTTTTTSSCVHQGDTTVVIQSKTTEVYDAQSQVNNLKNSTVMQRIEFIAPVEAMRGNLSGKQVLEYAENNNPAFDAPNGRQYAKNYQPRFIGAKRAADGKKYFAVKTKSATLINAASKHTMALLGGAGAMIGTILTTSAKRSVAERAFTLAKSAGATDAKTIRKYLTDILQVGLEDKKPIIAITASYDGESASLLLQNPWCYNGEQAGVACPVRNAILVKFWSELASNPVIFTVDGRKGVSHAGNDFESIATPNRYNVLNLTVTEQGMVKLGNSWLLDVNEEYVDQAVVPENGQKFTLTEVAPEP